MRGIPVMVLMIIITLTFAMMGFGYREQDTSDFKYIAASAVTEVNISQMGYTRVIVAVRNNSYKNFNGKIKITSLNNDNHTILGYDAFQSETLAPGQTIHWVTWITVAKVPNLKAEVVSGNFSSFEK